MLQEIPEAARYKISARFYDLSYGPLAPRDLPFYLELAERTGGPVLELACGTGRVGLELARAGHEVVGLDLSSDMLHCYQAKLQASAPEVQERVHLQQGNMLEFSLDREFPLVIMPFRAFQHVLNPEMQRRCLDAVHRHLTPGGRFVFNAFNPNLLYIAESAKRGKTWRYDLNTPNKEGGRLMRAVYTDPDIAAQTLRLMLRYETYDAEGQQTGAWVEGFPMRWLYRWEAQYLLELCSFSIEEAYGSYEKRALGAESQELILVCTRP